MVNLATKKSSYCKEVCKAWCCKHLIFNKDFLDQDDKLFFGLRGIPIDATNKLVVPMRCHWLNNHNMCRMYEHRPQSCKVYECEHLKKYKCNISTNEKTKTT